MRITIWCHPQSSYLHQPKKYQTEGSRKCHVHRYFACRTKYVTHFLSRPCVIDRQPLMAGLRCGFGTPYRRRQGPPSFPCLHACASCHGTTSDSVGSGGERGGTRSPCSSKLYDERRKLCLVLMSREKALVIAIYGNYMGDEMFSLLIYA